MKIRVFIITGFVLAGVGAGGYFGWQYLTTENAENGSAVYVTQISSLSEEASGTQNRYAGVVEPQDTLDIKLENGRKVSSVKVQVGQVVKEGDILFEYDLSSIEDDLEAAQLDYDQLLNEAEGIKEQLITYTKEQKKAKQDQQLSYTIQIETAKMSLKKNEYSQKSKAAEIERLKRSMGETAVAATMEGVITKIDTSQMESEDGSTFTDDQGFGSSSGSNAFITILSTGAYRVKGKVNEQNYQDIIPGAPVIIRSRVDETKTWSGTMGNIDTESTNDNNNNNFYFGMTDSQTSSSSYNFYVNLDNGTDLMLGQHVYIEMDEGQAAEKEGIWLNDYFLMDSETEAPYVWGIHKEGEQLMKLPVVLGDYDYALGEYEILEGLSEEDYIAFPVSAMEEGMRVIVTQDFQLMIEHAYELEQAEQEDLEGQDVYSEEDPFDYDFDTTSAEESWSEEATQFEDPFEDSLEESMGDDLDGIPEDWGDDLDDIPEDWGDDLDSLPEDWDDLDELSEDMGEELGRVPDSHETGEEVL